MVFESLKEKLRLGTGEKENGTRRKIQRRVSFAPEDFSAVQPPKQPISDAPGPFSFANPATEPASSPTQRNLSKKPSISGGSLASRKSSIIGEPYVPKGSAIPEESSAPSTALNQKKPSTPRSSSFSKEYASAKKPSPNPASPSSPVRPNETEVDKSTVEQQQTHEPDAAADCCIRVGNVNDNSEFYVNFAALAVSSKFFSASPPTDVISLPHVKPAIFRLFLKWVRSRPKPIVYLPGRYSEEPWASNALAAWFLAWQLDAIEFEKYCLSQFIQNCAVLIFGPWKEIEANAPPGSSLRQFSDHWVAWNSYLAGDGRNEYSGLSAAKNAVNRVASHSRDPRLFDQDHWFLKCGSNINPTCLHDPIVRIRCREFMELDNKPPPAEWGAADERRANAR